ncbi:MAG: hypothetical protein C7B45_04120 [Sulfobacillus acidophilus]|uniref:CN hydrolase domain-containing protein n=1 Tax=Sulfobacillus acidophilus TaxID=53633 RepID=A0A2T2WLP7_9FIRM|nr:MAG: hypothetical protein C7B45_04120 [Sulfobacillus acidophilus]
MMLVDLFCVQPYMRPHDYYTPEAFQHRVARYFSQADAMRQTHRPALIVFPEDIATFLLMAGHQDTLAGTHTMDAAFRAIGQKKFLALLGTMGRFQTLSMRRAFFTLGAAQVWRIWYTSMAELARQYHMTVVAGSALLPDNRWPYPTHQYQPKNSRIYNLSITIDPKGDIIYYTRKVNLVPTQEDQLDLTPGSLTDAQRIVFLPTTQIPLATAICYDGFCRPHTDQEPDFVNVLEALDRQGAKLVAQPSANPWWWNEPWPLERTGQSRLRSVQWDEEGSLAALQQCQNIEIIVNPQLQLEFLDLHFDGQSRILARHGAQVEILAASEFTRGPEADTVLHAVWDFSTT